MNRRGFLRLLGLGAVAAAAPAVLLPSERKIWQVGADIGARDRTRIVSFADIHRGVIVYERRPVYASGRLVGFSEQPVLHSIEDLIARDPHVAAMIQIRSQADFVQDVPQLREWLGPRVGQ